MTHDIAIEPQTLALDHWTQGTLYESSDTRLGPRLGLTALGLSYSEVPPGKSGCPFHNHHAEDELFVILAGEGTYRFGETRIAVRAGQVLGAPRGGPETAHQLINTGTVPLRYLSVSSKAAVDICEYPDSGKFLSKSFDPATGEQRFDRMVSGSGTVDYWKDEPGA